MKRILLFVSLLAGLLIGHLAAHADSGRGRHKQFYVVPTPGEVTIDGNLDDWDLSGQIEMFVVEATRSTQSGKVAAMYDEEAFYISGRINDPTPMMNRHDPKVEPKKAWDADSLQFRIVLDPTAAYPETETAFKYRGKNAPEDTRDDIVHLLLWHYTDESSANLQMMLGMGYRVPHPDWQPQGLVPRDKFEGQYVEWENGKGYNFEYRIPWSTLGAEKPLQGGDKVAGTMNVFWSRPDGLKTGGVLAWAWDVMGEPGFAFQSASCWGRVIFAEEGNVPRELVLEGVPPERPLPLEFAYELPEDGWTTIQLFDENNQARRIIVPQQERPGGVNTERWDGLDDRGELLPAGTYRWRGVFSTEPLQAKHRFSVHNSGRPPHPTDDNTGGWGADHGQPTTAVAFDDGVLLAWGVAEYGWGLIRTNFHGRKQWGSKHGAQYLATDGKRIYFAGDRGFHRSAEVRMLDIEDSRPTRLANGVASFATPSGGEAQENHPSGLTWHANRLYVAYGLRDLVAVYDTNNGKLLHTWTVPTPGRLAIRPDGTLAAISEGRILRVTDGEAVEWITTHLDEPQAIAVGPDGTAYVTNQGELQNISVFSADGTYQRSIGRPGGRPAMGQYDPSGMYQPGGITLDAKGHLWVAETTDNPKRFSVWNATTGELVDEFFGGSQYFAYGHIDPARPDEIYAHNVIWSIDWETYQAEPKLTIWRQTEADMPPAPATSAYGSGGGFRLITAENGRQFGYGGAPHRNVVVYMRDGDIFRPIAGEIDPWADRYKNIEALKPLRTKWDAIWDEQKLRAGHRPRMMFWQDLNDDGRMQADEFTVREKKVHKTRPEGKGSVIRMEEDMSLWLSCGRRLAPSEVTDDGKPVYDLNEAEETPMMGKVRPHGWTFFGDDGAAYVLEHGKGPSLVKWSPDGEMVWNYPGLITWRGALSLPTVGPGRLWAMTRPMGLARGYLLFQTYFGANQLFRTDGQYIGILLRDSRNQSKLGASQGQPEGQGGSFVELEFDGEKRMFMIHGGQDVRVWEVTGLDAIRDLPGGEYVHTEQQEAKARQAHREYMAAMAPNRDIRIVHGRDKLDDAPPATRKIEGDRGFEARTAYDEKNLYVRFDVTADHGLNNGQSSSQILFRGGNCLDIQLATDPDADPDREKPAPGDLRLLVTRKNDKPFAMLYRPRIEGFKGEPTVLVSPTGKEPFDAITEVDVGLEYEKTKTGFIATITVPLKTLAFRPRSGQQVRMDLGYVFGNAEGTKTVVRAYLHNNSFSANVVDDIPNESRLEPDEWGTAEVE